MHFENIVFAGGGNRCFWQAGFWSVASAVFDLKPARVASVSAGSAIACALFAGTFEQGFANFKQAIAGNERNVYPSNLLHRQPVFPHGGLYRDAILGSIDAPALARLHHGPNIHILVSCPPSWSSERLAFLLGLCAVGLDALRKNSVHDSMGGRFGFKPAFMSVRECATPDALADLIIASSCVPPLTPQSRRNGKPIFDGGLVSNVPTDGITEHRGQTLVLLSRQFASLPSIAGHTYVQPSEPIPVRVWDYTNHAALQATFDLGRRDGEAFCAAARPQVQTGSGTLGRPASAMASSLSE
jgi:predicted acylesterase/phospholipase RssA